MQLNILANELTDAHFYNGAARVALDLPSRVHSLCSLVLPA